MTRYLHTVLERIKFGCTFRRTPGIHASIKYIVQLSFYIAIIL